MHVIHRTSPANATNGNAAQKKFIHAVTTGTLEGYDDPFVKQSTDIKDVFEGNKYFKKFSNV